MAYDVIEENLEEGDPQVALRLLNIAGARLTDTSGAATHQAEHEPGDGPIEEE